MAARGAADDDVAARGAAEEEAAGVRGPQVAAPVSELGADSGAGGGASPGGAPGGPAREAVIGPIGAGTMSVGSSKKVKSATDGGDG